MSGAQTVHRARRLADDLLFPAAVQVDSTGRLPVELLDTLAAQGFYALGGLPEWSPPSIPDAATHAAVIEAFAGGCLAAAFVWRQHVGALGALVRGENARLRTDLGPLLASGELRSGLAIGAATRVGPPSVRARRDRDGWLMTGTAPWFTGWGLVGVMLLAGRDQDDQLVLALVDLDDPAISADPMHLLAVQAGNTVTLQISSLSVPDERVVRVEPHARYLDRDAESLVANGFLATGVAGRAIALQDEPDDARDALLGELRQVRAGLLNADAAGAPSARAASSELAVRAAARLAVHQGARSVLAGSHADRLLREAALLLTFGTRPGIRDRLLQRLAGSGAAGSGAEPVG